MCFEIGKCAYFTHKRTEYVEPIFVSNYKKAHHQFKNISPCFVAVESFTWNF